MLYEKILKTEFSDTAVRPAVRTLAFFKIFLQKKNK